MTEVLVWAMFLIGPFLFGMAMLWANQQIQRKRKLAAVHVAIHLALTLFLLTSFVQFNAILGRLAFYEFLSGCAISCFVAWFAYRRVY